MRQVGRAGAGVFSVWAVREDACAGAPDLAHDFLAAKREGIDHIDQIATQYAASLELPRSELLNYLTQNVNYDLDHENIAGMTHYFNLAHECGLIARLCDLRFVEGDENVEN